MKDHIKGGALTETTFYILLSLYTPKHGYGMMQFIEQVTNQRLLLGAGTLYGAINTLYKKGWIELYNDDERKKEYKITALGKQICEQEVLRLQVLLSSANAIIEEDSYE